MPLSDAERDNLTIWRPGRTGFYEVYYLKLNDPSQAFALWLRYTILAPLAGAPVAEVWAIAFDAADPTRHVAAKETFPPEALSFGRDAFEIRIGASVLGHGNASGQVSGSAGEIAWDLRFDAASSGLRHFPHAFMYRASIPKTKVLSPQVDVRFAGRVTAAGRAFDLASAPGMQAHLHGTRHAESWAWTHVNSWDQDTDTWLEGVSARIKVGPVPLPPLTPIALHHRGATHLFNSLEKLRRNRSVSREPSWTFSCAGPELRLEAELSAPPELFVGVRYEDPDGTFRYCRNSKVARATLRLYRPGDTTPIETLTSSAAALEFVSRTENPAVPTRI